MTSDQRWTTSDQFAYYGRDSALRVDAGEIDLSAGPDTLHGSRRKAP